jgi:hypothetical protein
MNGYRHHITFLSDHPEPAHELLPRVHLVVSLLKRWLLCRKRPRFTRHHKM